MRYKDSPLVWLIAGGLATWRITSIVQREGIFSPARKLVGVTEVGDDPEYWIYPETFIGRVLSCFWCGSVWAGIGVTIALIVFPPLILPFALSALAIWLKPEMEYEEDDV